jgi:hypothetical protein
MKTIYKNYMLMLCFFIGTAVTLAQNENIEWSAKSYLVNINDYDVEIESNLSKQASTFIWEQISNLSSQTQQYTVTSVSGTWNAQQNLGSINYTLTSEDDNANLIVSGTTEEVTMQFTILDTNGNPFKTYVFSIDTFTNL